MFLLSGIAFIVSNPVRNEANLSLLDFEGGKVAIGAHEG
jgi:hypothetical protein